MVPCCTVRRIVLLDMSHTCGPPLAAVLQGWATVALAQGGVMLNILFTLANRPPLLSVLLIFACGALLMITGMWLTVQFRFVQMQYPAVVLAFERQVLTASLPIAAVMQAIGIAAVTEHADVPYYLAAVLCLLYHMLARPLESSFHQSKAGRAIGGVSATPADAIVQVRSGAVDTIVSCISAHWLSVRCSCVHSGADAPAGCADM
eukprot:GHRQ01026620.1.p1 GENE.GHRQ01026620.1~~GHRQ01026620.1.p1  ORF type:complete len:205 (-),score=70.17 GHRQ01026620.1:98-712(-)